MGGRRSLLPCTRLVPLAAPAPAGPVRLVALDWLRLATITLVVFSHATLLYVGPVGSYAPPVAGARSWYEALLFHSSALRMPVLFLVAGASLELGARTHGLGALVRTRLRRLVLPLVVCAPLVLPVQHWLEQRFRHEYLGDAPPSLAGVAATALALPHGGWLWHLWFLPMLVIVTAAVLPLVATARGRRATGRVAAWIERLPAAAQLLLPALAMALVHAPPDRVLQPVLHLPLSSGRNVLPYLGCFVGGALLVRAPRLLARLQRGWGWHAAAALVALLAANRMAALHAAGTLHDWRLPLAGGTIRLGTWVPALLTGACIWLFVAAVFGLATAHIRRTGPLVAYARDATFPVYLLHQPFVMAMGYPLVDSALPGLARVLLVTAGGLAGAVACHELLLRRTRVTRTLFGIPERAAAPLALPAALHEWRTRAARRRARPVAADAIAHRIPSGSDAVAA